MADRAPPMYRVRAGGHQVDVVDDAALRRLAREGRIGPGTEVWEARTNAWSPASSLAALHDVLADPWGAFQAAIEALDELGLAQDLLEDATDDPTEAPDPQRLTPTAPQAPPPVHAELAPSASLDPEPSGSFMDDAAPSWTEMIEPSEVTSQGEPDDWPELPRPVEPQVEDEDDDATEMGARRTTEEVLFWPEHEETAEEAHASAVAVAGGAAAHADTPPAAPRPADRRPTGLVGPGGKVIAFPSSKLARPRARVERAEAELRPLKRAPVPVPTVAPPPPRTAPKVRWGRIVLLGAVAAALVQGWVWSVGAATRLPQAPKAAPRVDLLTEGIDPALLSPDLSASDEALAPLDQVTRDLRLLMRDAAAEVHSGGDLEDALFVELQQLGVDVSAVTVEVASMGRDPMGGDAEVPRQVALRVEVASAATSATRDKLAIGLVAGRYIDEYMLVVSTFDVVLPGPRGRPRAEALLPQAAQMLWAESLTPREFLRR